MALLSEVDRVLGAGRPGVAAVLLDALAASDPANPAIAIARARTALAQQQPDAAGALLDDAIDGGDPTGCLHLWRARSWLARGAPERALDDAQIAAAAAPHDAAAVGLCATLLMGQGSFGHAVRLLDDAITAGAEDVALHLALVVGLLSMGEPAAAELAVARGLTAAPDNPDLLALQSTARHAVMAGP